MMTVLTLLAACTPDPGKTLVVGDDTHSVTDTGTGVEAPLTLQLLHGDGTPALPGEPLRWTMWHGPGGGWHLQVVGILGPFHDNTVYFQVEGTTLGDQPFLSYQPTRFAGEVEGNEVRIDVHPDADMRLWAGNEWAHPDAICALHGTQQTVSLSVEQLAFVDDEEYAQPTGRMVEVSGEVTLVWDPLDEERCTEAR